jgi:hypothetical protein
VTLYLNSGFPFTTRLSGKASDLRWGFTSISAGYTRNQALITAQAVRDLFTGWRPFGANGPQFTEVDLDAPLICDDVDPYDVRYSLTLAHRLYTTRS